MLSAASVCHGAGAQSPRRDASAAVPRSGISLPYSQAPVGSGYPAFIRYYEDAKTSLVHPAGFGFPRLAVPLATRLFLSAPGRQIDPAAWRFSLGPRPVSLTLCGDFGISQVPREPPRAFALLSDPGRTLTPGHVSAPGCCSRHINNESSQRHDPFRGSITRLLHSLSTLRAAVTLRLRKTRFRLVAGLCRAGLATRWVPLKGFNKRCFCYPPFLGLSWRNDF